MNRDIAALLHSAADAVVVPDGDADAVLARGRRARARRRTVQGTASALAACALTLTLVGPITIPGVGTFTMPGSLEVRDWLRLDQPRPEPAPGPDRGAALPDIPCPALPPTTATQIAPGVDERMVVTPEGTQSPSYLASVRDARPATCWDLDIQRVDEYDFQRNPEAPWTAVRTLANDGSMLTELTEGWTPGRPIVADPMATLNPALGSKVSTARPVVGLGVTPPYGDTHLIADALVPAGQDVVGTAWMPGQITAALTTSDWATYGDGTSTDWQLRVAFADGRVRTVADKGTRETTPEEWSLFATSDRVGWWEMTSGDPLAYDLVVADPVTGEVQRLAPQVTGVAASQDEIAYAGREGAPAGHARIVVVPAHGGVPALQVDVPLGDGELVQQLAVSSGVLAWVVTGDDGDVVQSLDRRTGLLSTVRVDGAPLGADGTGPDVDGPTHVEWIDAADATVMFGAMGIEATGPVSRVYALRPVSHVDGRDLVTITVGEHSAGGAAGTLLAWTANLSTSTGDAEQGSPETAYVRVRLWGP